MTPMRLSPSASLIVMTLACAACSSSLMVFRTMVTIRLSSFSASASLTDKRTVESFGPRMSSTTSSRRQPTTSIMGPLSPWPTAEIMSAGFNAPDLSAGPAGTRRTMVVASSSVCSTAPIPSKESDMLMLKFVEVRGEKYWVCGSKVVAKALMNV